MKGYRGRLLKIDLASAVVEDVEIAADELRIYAGGGALATALLMKLTTARCDALSADNPFILATGPATGAAVSGVSRCSAVALSPLTGAIGESQAGGMLGPAMKRAGYDALVLTGKARAPVWIELGDDGARIHEAGEIAELQSSEVFDELEGRLGSGWTIMQCGPAGMRGVRHACLLAGRNDVFGRTGLGAVLGSKNVRAIAVKGTKKIDFADEAALKRLARAGAERLAGASFPATLHAHGTPGVVGFQAEAGNLATRNHSSGFHRHYEKLAGQYFQQEIDAGATTCFGCVVRCRRKVKKVERGISDSTGGPEFETLGMLGSNLDITDAGAVALANQKCAELGLDTITTGGLIAWLMECREKGLITAEQLDGIDLRFGDAEAALEMIDAMGRRSGIGRVLGEGFDAAVRVLGPETAALAVHTKQQGYPVHMPQVKPSQAIIYATSPIGPDHMSSEHDWLLEAGGDDCFGLGITGSGDRYSTGMAKIRMTVMSQYYYSLLDSLCLCMFCWGPGNLFRYNDVVELVNAATGNEWTFHELMLIGQRRIHLMRRANAARGIGRGQDRLAPRMFEPLVGGPSEGRRVDPAEFEKMLDSYYSMIGCDPATGHPTESKLAELGLEWTVDLPSW